VVVGYASVPAIRTTLGGTAMKRPNARLALLLAALLITPAFAKEPAKEPMQKINAPPAFERLKGLVGSWQGAAKGHEGMVTSFELVANGSALVERLAPAPDEVMVNVYHPDGDAVVMTHYCSAGNQPRMRCKKDGTSLEFTLDDITNWKDGETRMSAITVAFVDADHMNEIWTSDQGPEKGSMTMQFVRKK
jgi:hypothetical protein